MQSQTILPEHDRIVANFPAWRRFTDEQVVHIEDFIKCPYVLDAVFTFNIRPPELLFFDNFQVYCECFVVIAARKTFCMTDVAMQSWFDGASRLIKLRSCSIRKALEVVTAKADCGDIAAVTMLQAVFSPIAAGSRTAMDKFVHKCETREVVAVVPFVKPWDRAKYLLHLCKTLGTYKCESDLFLRGGIKQAFVKAGLLRLTSDVTRADLISIVKRYVETDLRFHPLSSRQFGRYLKAAVVTLHDLFFNDVLGNYSPTLTEVMLKDEASDALKREESLRRKNIIDALFDDPAVAACLPQQVSDTLKMQVTCDRIPYDPEITQTDRVSNEALAEHRSALACCVQAVDRFMEPTCRGVKFPCLVGRPGSGKSHVLKIAAAYCLCCGLAVEIMSWTSERARKLGGNRIHLVFPLLVTKSRISFTQDIVNGCLQRLERDPAKKTMMRRTDVFIIEELGLISSEYFVALDSILRIIMGNSLPFGGKLVMASGDCKQLPPVEGTMIWASLNLCTMMDVFVFKADVRARDSHLKYLNSECRRQLNEGECKRAANAGLHKTGQPCPMQPFASCQQRGRKRR